MSMETWADDWKRLGDIEEEKRIEDEHKIEVLEKFLERIQEIINAYDDNDKYEDLLKDLKWEVDNVEDEL